MLNNNTIKIDGSRYLDSGTSNILPINLAEQGMDRVLVVRSNRNKFKRTHLPGYILLAKLIYKKSSKEGLKLARLNKANNKYSASRMLMSDVYILEPEDSMKITRVTKNKNRLKAAGKKAEKLIYR